MIRIFHRSKKTVAQSLLEYTMIMALVAIAIIAMNRYVFRAIWAGIKGWEMQVNDSLVSPVGIGSGDCMPEGGACPGALACCPSLRCRGSTCQTCAALDEICRRPGMIEKPCCTGTCTDIGIGGIATCQWVR